MLQRFGLVGNNVENLLASLRMFYAVAKGRMTGIFHTWGECEAQIKGFPGAKFKKFPTLVEAEDFVGMSTSVSKQQFTPSIATPVKNSSSNSQSGKAFYAVAIGKKTGIYETWLECKAQVDDFKFPKYKKFFTHEEAEQFIKENEKVGSKSAFSRSDKSSKMLGGTSAARFDPPARGLLTTVRLGNCSFQTDELGFVHCYTDGACGKNGQVGANAGVGVWFGHQHPMNVSEPVVGPPTNNVAEIEAATRAIQVAKSCGIDKLQINTDSQFMIKCVTEWMPKWQKNGWKLSTGGDVKNRVQLVDLHNAMDKLNVQVRWVYVKAHCGIEGNEGADELARAGAALFSQRMKVAESSSSSKHRFKPY